LLVGFGGATEEDDHSHRLHQLCDILFLYLSGEGDSGLVFADHTVDAVAEVISILVGAGVGDG
jgi:hypothetical protein